MTWHQQLPFEQGHHKEHVQCKNQTRSWVLVGFHRHGHCVHTTSTFATPKMTVFSCPPPRPVPAAGSSLSAKKEFKAKLDGRITNNNQPVLYEFRTKIDKITLWAFDHYGTVNYLQREAEGLLRLGVPGTTEFLDALNAAFDCKGRRYDDNPIQGVMGHGSDRDSSVSVTLVVSMATPPGLC